MPTTDAVLAQSLAALTAEERLELFPAPGLVRWARKIGLGGAQAQERTQWLIDGLSRPWTAPFRAGTVRRLCDDLAECELVSKKDRVKPRRLGTLRQILVIADIGQRQRRGRRVPPRRLVVTATVDEEVEMQLPLHRFRSSVCASSIVTDLKWIDNQPGCVE